MNQYYDITDEKLAKLRRQAALEIIKKSDNLKFETYKPLIYDFQSYVLDIF